MSKTIDSILIVGGGTAGWMAAAYLARHLGSDLPNGVKITLVESSDIPVIGVGEGTFPSIRTTLGLIGIDEAEFIRKADATFKQGIKFVNWQTNPNTPEHFYYNLFENPHRIQNREELAPYWAFRHAEANPSFSDSVSFQHGICENKKAPKQQGDKGFFAPMNYAYHLDAGKLAELLKEHSLRLGIKHLIGTVDKVNLKENGEIASVRLEDGKELEADMFIDCTGFAAVLIDKTMGSKLKPVDDVLFVDRALVAQVPYEDEMCPIASSTLSTAQEAGWLWDIGLRHRRGTGHVYSSRHSTDEQAERVLEEYLGKSAKNASPRLLKMKTGYRETHWIKNCVSVGLSGGFLEPLEATGIVLIEAAIRMIGDYFPRYGDFDVSAKHFNRAMRERYEDAVSFVKLHYYLSKRDDNAFWIDNRNDDSVPDYLLEKLELWKHRLPRVDDFHSNNRMFSHEIYQYILLGMGFKPDIIRNQSAFPFIRQADEEFNNVQLAKENAVQMMPSHRDLIEAAQDESFKFG